MTKVSNPARPYYDVRKSWERLNRDSYFGQGFIEKVGGEGYTEMVGKLRRAERDIRSGKHCAQQEVRALLDLNNSRAILLSCMDADVLMGTAKTFWGRYKARRALKKALTFK